MGPVVTAVGGLPGLSDLQSLFASLEDAIGKLDLSVVVNVDVEQPAAPTTRPSPPSTPVPRQREIGEGCLESSECGVGAECMDGVCQPGLAAGGIVTRPTRALIGEAGPEAVVPLPDLDRLLASVPAPARAAPTKMTIRVPVHLGREQIAEAVVEAVPGLLDQRGILTPV